MKSSEFQRKQNISVQCGVATGQGVLAATRSWKRQGTDSPLEPLEGARPCQHLDFGPGILISDFWPLDLPEN